MSLAKSSVYFSKQVLRSDRDALAEMLDMSLSDGKGKFLGLPNVVGRTKKEIFNYKMEREGRKTRG